MVGLRSWSLLVMLAVSHPFTRDAQSLLLFPKFHSNRLFALSTPCAPHLGAYSLRMQFQWTISSW